MLVYALRGDRFLHYETSEKKLFSLSVEESETNMTEAESVHKQKAESVQKLGGGEKVCSVKSLSMFYLATDHHL